MLRISILLSLLVVLSFVLYGNGSLSAQEENEGNSTVSEQFQEIFQQWKQMLGKLRETSEEYKTAEPSDASSVREKYDEQLAEAEQLIPRLRQTAVNAYKADPNKDRAIIRLLVSMAKDDVDRDDYESAAELTQVLIENQCDEKDIYDWAGIAAFNINQFDLAANYLTRADEDGSISSKGRALIEEIPSYTTYWEEEKKLREAEMAADDLPRIKLTTSKGNITVELLENEAPDTVGNFINLVENSFYDGLTFHRVLAGFMAQGGCPDGNGQGGPGYEIYCECNQPNHRKHFRGSLSMAHAGPNTGGSQFFLTFVPTAHLNGKHTVFGRVIEGMDVLAKLNRLNPETFAGQPNPDKIVSAEVIRKRDHEYIPKKVQ